MLKGPKVSQTEFLKIVILNWHVANGLAPPHEKLYEKTTKIYFWKKTKKCL